MQDLNICTVRDTWQRWLREGMACLSDKPRSGAPSKLDQAAVERLMQWAREEPLTATQLLQRHVEVQGEPIHVETLTRILKANGLVWKRTRHSLKKSATLLPSRSPAKSSTS